MRDVAYRCEGAVSAAGLSRIESGERYPNVRSLEALAGVLDCQFVVAGDGTVLR